MNMMYDNKVDSDILENEKLIQLLLHLVIL